MSIEIRWHNTGAAYLVNTTLFREVLFTSGDDYSRFCSAYRYYKNIYPASYLERLWHLYENVSHTSACA